MTRRLRLRPPGGRSALGALAAAALVAGLVLTGLLLPGRSSDPRPAASPTRTTTISTQAPYRLGGKVECPPDWPVLAMSDHTSYPAGHPATPPASATAVACYQTPAKAASAGYTPAPLPAGALEVGGVY